ncbi:MAG: hypothetical protein LBI02_00140 [Opitutaceae bacterium]|jgi:hypothetical protein|nr:hypothetical protein [Opitutaceae bacterium]
MPASSPNAVRLAACECLTPFGGTADTLAALLRGESALRATPVLGSEGGDAVPLALLPGRALDETAPPAWLAALRGFLAPVCGPGWGSARRPVCVTSSNFGVGSLYAYRRALAAAGATGALTAGNALAGATATGTLASSAATGTLAGGSALVGATATATNAFAAGRIRATDSLLAAATTAALTGANATAALAADSALASSAATAAASGVPAAASIAALAAPAATSAVATAASAAATSASATASSAAAAAARAHTPHGSTHGSVALVRGACGWGENVTVFSHACVSAHLGLLHAARLVGSGAADAALVVSYDFLSPFVTGGFHALKILNAGFPAPYRERATGSIGLGDGAAFAVVARDRGDFALGAHALHNEMFHATANRPDGAGFAAVFAPVARAAAGRGLRNLWVKGHGTGTLEAGRLETAAAAAAFPGARLTGWKGGLGHTLGSCGLVELAVAAAALRGGRAPGVLAADTAGGAAPALAAHVALEPIDTGAGDGVVCASNAFGGAHAALLLHHV